MAKLHALWLLATLIIFMSHIAGAFPRKGTPPPPLQLPWQTTSEDEVIAAQQFLLCLMGPTVAANGTLRDYLMPPGSDPCQPANFSMRSNPSPGYCGPQPYLITGFIVDWPCQWSWLSCTAGRIVAVDLSCQQWPLGCKIPLRGALPPAGPLLPELVWLNLFGNSELNGGLDLSGWERLPNLLVLNMSGCGFDGPLPAVWTAVPNVQTISLSMNRFTGTLPSGMGDLKQLQTLMLGGNTGLSGYLPAAWDDLDALRLLDVRGACRLCGTTSMFASLSPSSTLTSGTHVDVRCRPEECDGGWRGLHNVFQGVMAAFASVLGLTALVLVIRRVRDYASAHARARDTAARLAANTAADGIAAGTSSTNGDGGPTTRGSRRQRRHPHGGSRRPVPLYSVEFDAEGGVRWGMELAGSAGAPGCNDNSGGSNGRALSASQPQQRSLTGTGGGLEQQPPRTEQNAGLGLREQSDMIGRGAAAGRAVELVQVVPPVVAPAVLPSVDEEPEAAAAGQSGAPGGSWRPAVHDVHALSSQHGMVDASGGSVPVLEAGVPAAAERNREEREERHQDRLVGSQPASSAGDRQRNVAAADGGRAQERPPVAAAGTDPMGGSYPSPTPTTTATAEGAARNQESSAAGTLAAATMAPTSSWKVTVATGNRELPPPPDAIVLMPDGIEVCLARRLSCYTVAEYSTTSSAAEGPTEMCGVSPVHAPEGCSEAAGGEGLEGTERAGAGAALCPLAHQASRTESTSLEGSTSTAGPRRHMSSIAPPDGGNQFVVAVATVQRLPSMERH